MTARLSILGMIMPAVALCACDTRPTGDAAHKPEPVSRLQYRLEVDQHSLPAGVTAHERRVPGTGQMQTWLRNDTTTPFVVLRVDRQGNVTQRRKIVSGQVFLATRASGASQAEQWLLLEGVEQVLLSLNFTPEAIVKGRFQPAGASTTLPPPEPFSIAATFDGAHRPVRGRIIYFATPDSAE